LANRREVLRAVATLPFVAAPLANALGAGTASLQLERFVFDVRFAESGAIAAHMERLGVPLAPTADDLMSLWYDELDLAWREAPMALAGVTLADALFVLETFALDRGMHVVYRGEHGVVENERIAHTLAGPAPLLEQLSPPAQGPWEQRLAVALTQCPLGSPTVARSQLVTEGAALSLRDAPLHSWIIAPRAAVTARVS
jgi:hypothetical protein